MSEGHWFEYEKEVLTKIERHSCKTKKNIHLAICLYNFKVDNKMFSDLRFCG